MRRSDVQLTNEKDKLNYFHMSEFCFQVSQGTDKLQAEENGIWSSPRKSRTSVPWIQHFQEHYGFNLLRFHAAHARGQQGKRVERREVGSAIVLRNERETTNP